jgi:hypothetical protein
VPLLERRRCQLTNELEHLVRRGATHVDDHDLLHESRLELAQLIETVLEQLVIAVVDVFGVEVLETLGVIEELLHGRGVFERGHGSRTRVPVVREPPDVRTQPGQVTVLPVAEHEEAVAPAAIRAQATRPLADRSDDDRVDDAVGQFELPVRNRSIAVVDLEAGGVGCRDDLQERLIDARQLELHQILTFQDHEVSKLFVREATTRLVGEFSKRLDALGLGNQARGRIHLLRFLCDVRTPS